MNWEKLLRKLRGGREYDVMNHHIAKKNRAFGLGENPFLKYLRRLSPRALFNVHRSNEEVDVTKSSMN